MIYRFALAALILGAMLQSPQPAAAQSAPNPAPTATPGVVIPPELPPLVKYEHYASASLIAPAIVCDAFSPCSPGQRYRSNALRAAVEFPLIGNKVTGMLKLDSRVYDYQAGGNVGAFACLTGSTNQGCVTGIGPAGTGRTAIAPFEARNSDYDLRAGLRALEPRLYLGVSYLQRTSNNGYPRLRGYGLGLEKLPDTDQTFSLYGGLYYYPSVRGTFTNGAGNQFQLAYHVVRYDVGATLKPSSNSPIFVDLGYLGDKSRNGGNAPGNITHAGPTFGLGITF